MVYKTDTKSVNQDLQNYTIFKISLYTQLFILDQNLQNYIIFRISFYMRLSI